MRATWLREMADSNHSNCGDRDADGAPSTMRFHAYGDTTLKPTFTMPDASDEPTVKPKLTWQTINVQRYSGTESVTV